MTQPIEPLGLSANQWQFLSSPDDYVAASDRTLVPESTRRQFQTARDILSRLNGSYGKSPRRGIMLADDVGLGKTTVAALVAWVVASAGERRGVRILAPNDVMVRRWEEELLAHVVPLQKCALALDVWPNRVKARRVARLSAGSIQVVKHSYAASDFNLACDLLIIDEAHRAKGEHTAFSAALKRQKKFARRVLILTATPFSIRLDELVRMLTLIGGDSAHRPVRAFSRALDDLHSGNTTRKPEGVAQHLATTAKAAVDALSPFVIRHSIEDLPRERNSFGDRGEWDIPVPPANPGEMELMLRMDRALRVAKSDRATSSRATNDPRFHVGWRHFDKSRADLKLEGQRLVGPIKAVVKSHLRSINRLRANSGTHSKIVAVSNEVKAIIAQGEKVVLFCHHHATAQELTLYLASVFPKIAVPKLPQPTAWKKAWDSLLKPAEGKPRDHELCATFIKWLCSDPIRAQTWTWICAQAGPHAKLETTMSETNGRNRDGGETIAAAAQRLFGDLMRSRSSRAVLRTAVWPGSNGTSRVLGVCEPSENNDEKSLFIHNHQPDTIISIFNSPFGPDVLVVTDKLSEGIDLHRYCRHLVHYELDPSPIRTVQRNGRLRRVSSWAAVTGQPIRYAYPAFGGTRDHRLVQIMKKRIDSFSLLLGGVQDFAVEDVESSDETWRNKVIGFAKKRLAKAGGALCAKEPEAKNNSER